MYGNYQKHPLVLNGRTQDPPLQRPGDQKPMGEFSFFDLGAGPYEISELGYVILEFF